ncbi:cellulose biosynthesis protein BcsD [Acidovorax sp. sic0104]|uniref:cellulose biosynthesis protein BcsD n=1 Tax=Acidovorax sp. sic0104 TaxID=2854784 RepID=UPI001C48E439|nr:cellulose biosynthesis protein BcsD [Acidovorax sp. sic0104]MBV7541624.1 cellulose synthase [Acidovorax sp. sic0104]
MSHSVASFPGPEIAQHLATQQCAAQWRGFLQALTDEFASSLPPEDLHALMFRVGTRFAAANPLERSSTLEDLQRSMTAVWERIDWGWVQLTQEAARLHIQHSLSPVSAAFGMNHVQWSGGFLEGVYQSWFEQAGSGALRVVQVAASDAWGCVQFQLAR